MTPIAVSIWSIAALYVALAAAILSVLHHAVSPATWKRWDGRQYLAAAVWPLVVVVLALYACWRALDAPVGACFALGRGSRRWGRRLMAEHRRRHPPPQRHGTPYRAPPRRCPHCGALER